MIKEFSKIYKGFAISHEEMLAEIYFVLDVEFSLSKKQIVLGKSLPEQDFQSAKNIFLKRVKTSMPIQYVISKARFCDDIFEVNENVLIPRDDTEILVQKSKELIKDNALKQVLDIGTGSGIIAIELAKCDNVQVTAGDISEKALCVAKKNAQKLNVKVDFVQSDLFEKIIDKFDLIVSNPPYIPSKLCENLQTEVKDFEPHMALFAQDNGLYFYKQIIFQAPEYLNKKGFLAFETGVSQAQDVAKLLQKDFVNIFVIKDVSGIERVVGGQLK